MPNVQALVYFDARKACDYRIATSARSLAGLRRLALDPPLPDLWLTPCSSGPWARREAVGYAAASRG